MPDPDLTALAAKYGGTPAPPPGMDLAALAAKYGGKSAQTLDPSGGKGQPPSDEYGSTGFEAYGEALQDPAARAQQTATLKSAAPMVAGTGASMVAGPWAGAGAYLGTKAALSPEEVRAHPVATALEAASFPAAEYAPGLISAGMSKAAPYVKPVGGAAAKTVDAATFGRLSSLWNAWKDVPAEIKAEIAARNPPVYPGANLPAAPETATLQAGALQHPGAAPPPAPGSALASIPVRTPAKLPAAFQGPGRSYEGPTGTAENPARTVVTDPETGRPEFSDVLAAKQPMPKPAEVEAALNESLGGKPLERNVPLRQQMQATAPKANALPEGFTPVDSSVIKGYKYDPQAQEFTAITNNGQTYTHGEVTPDQVAAFEGADSKGRAWTSAIRNSSPLVKKNGLPVKTATMGTATGEVIPKAQAGMEDLTGEWQRALDALRVK